MSIYVVAPKSGMVRVAYEASPKVVLVTDADSPDAIPEALGRAADEIRLGSLSALQRREVPDGADGVIVWGQGDRLTAGTAADIRADLLTPGRRTFVPVHFPCLPEFELDLIALQPRWWSAGSVKDRVNSKIRIAASPSPSKKLVGALQGCREPWSRLYRSLLDQGARPQQAIDRLVQLWQSGDLEPMLASLLLRNLIVLLLRDRQFLKAEELITLGMKAYPDYAELPFLAAVSCILQEKPSKAMPHLEDAVGRSGEGFVGSGGESSYRANWLRGTICSLVGEQEMAVKHFFSSLYVRPAFRPSVEGLLAQRVSSDRVYITQWPICELVRREPEYLDLAIGYFLLHRQFTTARRLTGCMDLRPEARAAFEDQINTAARCFEARREGSSSIAGVIVEGPILMQSSLAQINRELGGALLQASDIDAALEPRGFANSSPRDVSNGELLDQGLHRSPQCLDLTVRLTWPPDFRPPSAGKLACILPWEYEAVPRKWIADIQEHVDELWVPSDFVRNAFLRGGVDPDRLRVIPPGLDVELFQPEGESWQPDGSRGFVFLFVGGMILRKGVDLLLEAYGEAFTAEDEVTLILKQIGSHSFYQHNTLADRIRAFTDNPASPHLTLIREGLQEAKLAALYRGSDAFVLPYRGEGFGMPIAEAMACGKPVVTTALGPAQEFCPPELGYMIPARVVPVPDDPPALGELTGELTWFEPDVGELARTLRYIYENRDEAASRGMAGAGAIRTTHSWQTVNSMYLERIRHLVHPAQ